MKKLSYSLYILLSTFSISANADTIFISAASSLSKSLTILSERFEKNTSHNIVLNFASSSVLARQIEYGFNADIYISANSKWIQYLNSKKVLESNIEILAKNALVLAHSFFISNDLVQRLNENLKQATTQAITEEVLFIKNMGLIEKEKISLVVGDVTHVPLGEYTKQTLDYVDLFDEFEPLLISASNARGALAFIEQGQASFAILYSSDVSQSQKVRALQTVPSSFHDPILYYLTKIKKTGKTSHEQKNVATEAFYNFLLSSESQKIFQEYGFFNDDRLLQ